MEQGFTSLLALVQGIEDANVAGCEVIAVTSALHDIMGTEHAIPTDATILGPCRTARHESLATDCRNVDIDLARSSESATVQHLLAEILSSPRDPVVGLRGHHRWVETFEPIRLPPLPPAKSPYREGGVYLIAGGYGGLGLALGKHLARVARAKVILVGRSGFPRPEGPVSASTRESMEKMRAIEEAGGEVLALTGDVGDAEQMRDILGTATERFGVVHGVFQLAGVAPYGLIPWKTAEQANEILHPKVTGSLVLHSALQEMPLDFFVMFSSINSVTGGGPGQVDDCAANAFLDAFASTQPNPNGRLVSIGWDQWQWDAWQEGLWSLPEKVRREVIERRRRYGISPEDGCEALDRVLWSRRPHVIVSPRSLPVIVEECREFSVSRILDRALSSRQPKISRPDLSSGYVAPATPTERKIAAVWEELLNIEQVGVDDDFFELGGNSLTGVQLIARLRENYPCTPIPVVACLEVFTVRSIARKLDEDGGCYPTHSSV
jgi:NADP-dependent 3-hydroxy acid dehydrogenase YdfG